MSILAQTSEPWWIALIEALIVINLVLVTFAYTTLIERKLLGRMQLRFGPNRAGPFGLLQSLADGVKLREGRAVCRSAIFVERGKSAPIEVLLVRVGPGKRQVDVVEHTGIGRSRLARSTRHQPLGKGRNRFCVVGIEECAARVADRSGTR